MIQSRFIKLAAAIIYNEQNSLLFVRKHRSAYYMFAGGKIEAHEDNVTTLVRELNEELHITAPAYLPQWLGHYSAPAANEEHHQLQADIFTLYWPYPIQVDAEIEQALWVNREQLTEINLAPLARHVLSSWGSTALVFA